MQSYDFGMIGLGVMGRNFLLNVADNGFSAAGYNRSPEKADALNEEAEGRPVIGTSDLEAFVGMLKKPRRIMLMVSAGKAVDLVIDELLPLLDHGDLIIDGGNSHYDDTIRRLKDLKEKGFRFLGVGVSGGAEGARRGPSIMPGGERSSYVLVQPVLEAVSAKVGGEPCVAYMGDGAAGHFVKMVHNGIEYAIMQLIAEVYDLMRNAGGMSNAEIQEVFAEWNEGRLRSFLIDITAEIFKEKDSETGKDLVDIILDKAKQKGTGKWTSQAAMDLGIPIPTIDSAVSMRGISSFKKDREKAGSLSAVAHDGTVRKKKLVKVLEEALYLGYVAAYAQGLHMLAESSREFDFTLDLSEIAKIWRGGCIIRADMLEDIRKAFKEEPELEILIFGKSFQAEVLKCLPSARQAIQIAMDHALPVMALASALNYVEAFHTANLPLNLTQAQRDFFGSHTYERVDKEGIFHTDW